MSEKKENTKNMLQEAGIIPEAQETYIDAVKWLDENSEKTLTSYGHSIGILAQIIANQEGKTPEQQKAALKERAKSLADKYGEEILEFMRPELRDVLGLEEFKG